MGQLNPMQQELLHSNIKLRETWFEFKKRSCLLLTNNCSCSNNKIDSLFECRCLKIVFIKGTHLYKT